MRTFAKVILIISIIMLIILISVFLYFGIVILQTKEEVTLDMSKLNSYNAQIKICDKDGEEFLKTSAKGNAVIELKNLNDYTIDAFISIEDKKFYKHNGLNLGRIVKASIKNILNGYAKEGASTITQQLIKNTHLSHDKTMKRKIQEAYLAVKLENKYSKDEILETYLNVIYFGNSAYGLENAALNYFGKSSSELTLDESAILAGLIKSPKKYSPIYNKENCLKRRNLVLKNMLEDGKITTAEYENAISKPISVLDNLEHSNVLAQRIIEKASQILDLSESDLSTGGYTIITYIDDLLQSELEKNYIHLENINSSAIVIDNQTNGVKAYVGNGNINRSVGSTIKPILSYAPAFELGKLTPATPILDEKIKFSNYTPSNINGKYVGWTDARTALSKSYNIPAIKTLEYVGVDKAKEIAQKFGVKFSEQDNHLALALGAFEYGNSLETMTNAYSVFANRGKYNELSFIKQIIDRNNNIIYNDNKISSDAISEDTAFLINDILKDTTITGTAKRLNNLGIPICAKTGTVGSQNKTNTDAWCISYNPSYTVGVWYGNISGNPKYNLLSTQNGGSTATKQNYNIWTCLKKLTTVNTPFTAPNTVQKVNLNVLDLQEQRVKIASENTPPRYIKSEYFSVKYLPTQKSTKFNDLDKPTLQISNKDNKITLTWDGEDYLVYEVYCVKANQTFRLAYLEGKNEKQTYTESTPTVNTEYYILAKYELPDYKYTAKSNSVYLYKNK